ncbi:hypothetical protein FRC17_006714 [Serendipita sp. 399]|nr:hypothetical protein FRC17_006714 [Serendipita sp. 399]
MWEQVGSALAKSEETILTKHQTFGRQWLPQHAMSSTRDSINKLPNELLRDIFLQCRTTEGVSTNASFMLVCKRWKHLVNSTPHLWNSFEADLGNTIPSAKRCRRLVEVCISASGRLPLDISVELAGLSFLDDHAHFSKDPQEDNAAQDLFKQLARDLVASLATKALEVRTGDSDKSGEDLSIYVSHMERWRSFQITFHCGIMKQEMEQILSPLRYPTPILKMLDLQFAFTDWLDIGADLSLPEEVFPDLRNLTTLTTNAAINLSEFHQSGHSLHTISFDVTPESFAYLPSFPNLQVLDLSLDRTPDGGLREPPSDPITLPQLTTLTFTTYLEDELLPLISAPNLRRLRFGGIHVAREPFPKPLSILNSIHLLEWDFPHSSSEEQGDLIRESLPCLFSQCHQLVEFETWAARSTSASSTDPSPPDPMKLMVREALETHPLVHLQKIVFRSPGSSRFEDSKISEVVFLPFK